jgi:hypothetical protein
VLFGFGSLLLGERVSSLDNPNEEHDHRYDEEYVDEAPHYVESQESH